MTDETVCVLTNIDKAIIYYDEPTIREKGKVKYRVLQSVRTVRECRTAKQLEQNSHKNGYNVYANTQTTWGESE